MAGSDSYDGSSNVDDGAVDDLKRQKLHINLDMSAFPHPLRLPWPIQMVSQNGVNEAVVRQIVRAAVILRRAPTQDEQNALAYHVTHSARLVSYGQPLGFAAGAYRAWSTRKVFKFPFRKPFEANWNEWGRFNRVFFTGSQARLAWHVTRTLPYVSIGWLAVSLFFVGYGASVQAVGQQRDPRLREFVMEQQKLARQVIQERNAAGADVKRQGKKRADDLWKKNRGSIGVDDGDNMSPGGGMDEASFARESDDAERVNRTENSEGSPSLYGEQNQGGGSAPARTSAWNKVITTKQESERPQSGYYDDGNDDASPTAGNSDTAVRSGSNSWEKIRQGAAANASSERPQPQSRRPAAPANQRNEEASKESYSPSSEEENRHLAKDQAQKEFDKLLEQERNVGGSEDGNRRW